MTSINLKNISTSDLSITGGKVNITDSTNSTSVNTGSVVTVGGIGCGGDIYISGRIQNSSDNRLKEITGTIDNVLDKVDLLNPVYYKRIDKSDVSSIEIGLIAQEVKEVFPELVTTDDNGYNYIDYSRITSILIQCVKDMRKEINSLKKDV